MKLRSNNLIAKIIRRITYSERPISVDALFPWGRSLNALPTRDKHLWIIAAPKSGSTWLSAILRELLHWPEISLTNNVHERREQEIDITSMFSVPREQGTVFSPHQHCRYSARTIDIMDHCKIHGILTTRNIFDAVVSFRDHLDRESVEFPHAFMTKECWAALSEETKMGFVVDLVVPWYFNFYAGWFNYLQKNPESQKVRELKYEELLTDPVRAVRGIANWAGLSVGDEEITNAVGVVSTKETRKNKGVVGRGSNLAPDLVQRIQKMASYYPGIDFSGIGIS